MKTLKKHALIIVVMAVTVSQYLMATLLFPQIDAYTPLVVLGDYYELTLYGWIFIALIMITPFLAGMIIGTEEERKRN